MTSADGFLGRCHSTLIVVRRSVPAQNRLSLIHLLAASFEQLVDLLRDDEPDTIALLLDTVKSSSQKAFRTCRTLSIGPQSLVIHELSSRKATFGGHTWHAAPVLSSYLQTHSSLIEGRDVIELGCGTGVCGIVACKLGARRVLVTDYFPVVVTNAAYNLHLNGCDLVASIRDLDWQAVEDDERWPIADKFDVVLASDCVYEERHGRLLPLVAGRLLKGTQRCLFLAISPAPVNGRLLRAGLATFDHALSEAGFDTVKRQVSAPTGEFLIRECRVIG